MLFVCSLYDLEEQYLIYYIFKPFNTHTIACYVIFYWISPINTICNELHRLSQVLAAQQTLHMWGHHSGILRYWVQFAGRNNPLQFRLSGKQFAVNKSKDEYMVVVMMLWHSRRHWQSSKIETILSVADTEILKVKYAKIHWQLKPWQFPLPRQQSTYCCLIWLR